MTAEASKLDHKCRTACHTLQGSQESSCGRQKTLISRRPFRRSVGPSSCQAMISWALQPPGLARLWPLAFRASSTSWRRRLRRQRQVSFKHVPCMYVTLGCSACGMACQPPDHQPLPSARKYPLWSCPVLTEGCGRPDVQVKVCQWLSSSLQCHTVRMQAHKSWPGCCSEGALHAGGGAHA